MLSDTEPMGETQGVELPPGIAADLADLMRQRDEANEELWRLIRRLVDLGYSMAAVGRALGISRAAVSQGLKRR